MEKWTQWRKERRSQGRQDEERKGCKDTTKGKKLGWKTKRKKVNKVENKRERTAVNRKTKEKEREIRERSIQVRKER